MVCVFFAALPDWLGGLVFGAATRFGMALAAYFTSSYIKIGGRIYAFHAADERPDLQPGDAPPSGTTRSPAGNTSSSYSSP